MKKFLAILLALTLVLSMAACAAAPAKTEEKTDAPAVDAQPAETPAEEAPVEETPAEEPAAEPVELIVFAAASMTETLSEIGNKFMERTPTLPSSSTSIPRVRSRPRSKRALTVMCSFPPVRSR